MILNLIKKHPIALSFLVFYLFWAWVAIGASINFHQIPNADHGNKLTTGEGAMYGILLVTMLAAVGAISMIGGVFIFKTERRFYFWALVVIIAPLVILCTI